MNMNQEKNILELDDTKYETILTKKFANRKSYKPADPKVISSVIPGTIVDLFVSKGQQVLKGDKLLILEAMKMKNTIFAPMDAKIKSININKGERVPKSHTFLEFE